MTAPAISLVTVRTRGPEEHRVVEATVVSNGTVHRIGWLPSESWFCGCMKPRKCQHIATVAALVPAIPKKAAT